MVTSSAFQYRRYDQRVPTGRLAQVAPHRIKHVIPDVVQPPLLPDAAPDVVEGDLLDLLNQFLVARHPAQHDLDARLAAGDRHDHDDTLFAEHLTVTDDRFGDLITRLADAVDQHDACFDLAGDDHVVLGQLKNVAVDGDERLLRLHRHAVSQASMVDLVAHFTVPRQEELRPGQVQDQLQLFLAGVTGGVHLVGRRVVDVHPLLVKLVDDPAHRLLVTWDGVAAQDHRVTGHQLDLAVGAAAHAGESRHRLTL